MTKQRKRETRSKLFVIRMKPSEREQVHATMNARGWRATTAARDMLLAFCQQRELSSYET